MRLLTSAVFVAPLFIFLAFFSCKKDEVQEPTPTKKQETEPKPQSDTIQNTTDTLVKIPAIAPEDSIYFVIDSVMHHQYLWYDKINQIDWYDFVHNQGQSDYELPELLLSTLKHSPIDRWSTIYRESEFNSEFTSVQAFGYGVVPFTRDNETRAAIVYSASDAYAKGLRRGDKITAINGNDPTLPSSWYEFYWFFNNYTQEITFLRDGEEAQTVSITAEYFNNYNILDYRIIDSETNKIAYLSYNNFQSASQDSLLAVLDYFSQNNANELVLDLRYNTGGELTVMDELINRLVPMNKAGMKYLNVKHNELMAADMDTSYTLSPASNSLQLQRIFIICTDNTASASEALINSLSTFMTVHLVGTTTKGKPVGMYAIHHKDWVLMPICFETSNSIGKGGYFDGISPDFPVTDDITKNWGDPEEACLAACLSYIETGSYNIALASSGLKSQTHPVIPFKQYGMIADYPR